MYKNTFLRTVSRIFSASLCLSGVGFAQTPLNAPEARISDPAIHADYRAYEQLEERIHRLNEQGIPVRDYFLSKAQCWLDVSLHEYSRNDRTPFTQDALTESERLIVLLEHRTRPASMETPLVNGAARLRPDLWARTADLKQGAALACVGREVACAEVELVHAGNEFNQQQWRHAKPYVQIAEELLSDASARAASCPVADAPAPAPLVPVLAPAAAERVPAAVKVALSAQVLFDFDQFTPSHIRDASRAELEALVARVKRDHVRIGSLQLVGHADRLNGTGNKNYNLQLSQKRVKTVRDLLAAQEMEVSGVSIDARGDTDQVLACQNRFKTRDALQECLSPNRRVQVELLGVISQN
jgi:outer membrane protein OmpA-like peptidoglycan-associated protein